MNISILSDASGIAEIHSAAKQKVGIAVRFSCVIPMALTMSPSIISDRIAVRFIHDMIMLYVVPSDPSGHFLVVYVTIGSTSSIPAMALTTPLAIAYWYVDVSSAIASANPVDSMFSSSDRVTAVIIPFQNWYAAATVHAVPAAMSPMIDMSIGVSVSFNL